MPYKHGRDGDGLGKRVNIFAVIHWEREIAARDGGKFRWKDEGDTWSKPFGLPRLIARTLYRLPKAEEGTFHRFRSDVPSADHEPYVIKKVKPNPTGPPVAVPNFPGYDISHVNTRLQRILMVAAGFDPALRCNGLDFTRVVANTSIYSQHSKWRYPNPATDESCLGNAADLVFPLPPPTGVDMERLRTLKDYLITQGRADTIDLRRVVFEDKSYDDVNDYNPVPYTGIYHYHDHVEAQPQQTGSVCA